MKKYFKFFVGIITGIMSILIVAGIILYITGFLKI
jgi:hypothetical protein